MAITTSISQEELRRLAIRSYEGRTLWVRLCNAPDPSYTENTLVSLWREYEVDLSNGYAPFNGVIQVGAYDGPSGKYKLPFIDAEFSASGGTYNYTHVLVYVDDYIAEQEAVTNTNISFQTTTNTITQTTGDFTTLFNDGEYVLVQGATGGNDGVYQIDTVSTLVLTLSANTPLATTVGAGPSITLTRQTLYPYAIIQESPNIVLVNGQSQTYRIQLSTDDG